MSETKMFFNVAKPGSHVTRLVSAESIEVSEKNEFSWRLLQRFFDFVFLKTLTS